MAGAPSINLDKLLHAISAEIDDARIKNPEYGRALMIKAYDKDRMVNYELPATFLTWGLRWDPLHRCQVTVAVVRYPDGKVGMKYPEALRFVESAE